MIKRSLKKLASVLSVDDYATLNVIELNRKNLLNNYNYFKGKHQDKGVIPVLKANAYGHGLVQVAEMLNGADCDFLAVDGYFEATQIQKHTKHRILVLGYIKPKNVSLLDFGKCSYVVQDLAGLEAFGRQNKKVRVHLEINTGMNRLGISDNEIDEYLETLSKYPNLQLEGVMTHLADADNSTSNDFTETQVFQFDRSVQKVLSKGFTPRYIHVAQTAGSTKAMSKYANYLRIGIGLYGINPLEEGDEHFTELNQLQPVLTAKSTIIKVVSLKKGDRVSYNGIFIAPDDMKIGVIPFGYYEGLPRELSGKGWVTCNEVALNIVGRICMNHTMVDLKDNKIEVGSEVVVIDGESSAVNSVQNICKVHGLFSYTLVTKLSSSTRRIII